MKSAPKTCVRRILPALLTAALITALAAIPAAQAQPMGWGGGDGGGWGPGWGSGWGEPGWPASSRSAPRSRDPREGQVNVSRFVIDSPAAALGHGPVTVASESDPDGTGWLAPNLRAAYEAAVIDSLVGAGYDTLHAEPEHAQHVTLAIARRVLVPAEDKRSPVSGSAAMAMGTHGSAYGLAVNVDLSKPRPALVSTRLDMRILDHAGGTVLWEGHATIATRDGDDDWSEDRIAHSLAAALLDRFPDAQPVSVALAPAPAAPPPPADEAPPPPSE